MQQTHVAEPTTSRRHPWHRASTRWLTVPLQVLVDGLSVYAAHRLAYLLRVATLDAAEPIPPAAPYDDLALYSAIGALGVFAGMGLYGERSGQSRWREALQVIAAIGLIGMLDLALIFFVRS